MSAFISNYDNLCKNVKNKFAFIRQHAEYKIFKENCCRMLETKREKSGIESRKYKSSKGGSGKREIEKKDQTNKQIQNKRKYTPRLMMRLKLKERRGATNSMKALI